jgi:DNA repair protein RecO (recombination protein O)
MEYGESSRIATLFTLEFGKMAVLARGSRNPKSKFGSTLEVLSYIQAVIYIKQNRDLQSISEATFVRTFPSIRESLQDIETGLRMMELTNAFMQDGDPNRDVFSLLASSLTALGTSTGQKRNILPFFQMRLASILGFAPGFDKSDLEHLSGTHGALELESGIIGPDSMPGHRATRSALRAFAILSRATLSAVLNMEMSASERGEMEELVSTYLKYHFEEAYPRRSERVFSRLGKFS